MRKYTYYIGIIIIVLLLFGAGILAAKKFNEDNYYDVPWMVYVNSTLFMESTGKGYQKLQSDIIYLGEISSFIHQPEEPQAEFQSNDESIIGSKVYQYGKKVVVLINGKYWIFIPCER